jgi:hypothetical protein
MLPALPYCNRVQCVFRPACGGQTAVEHAASLRRDMHKDLPVGRRFPGNDRQLHDAPWNIERPMSDPNLSSFIWSVADLLRGDYKQSEYGKVILPFTVLRRLDCVRRRQSPLCWRNWRNEKKAS